MCMPHGMTTIIGIELTVARPHTSDYTPAVCHRHLATAPTISESSGRRDGGTIAGDWTGEPTDLTATNTGADNVTTSRPLQPGL